MTKLRATRLVYLAMLTIGGVLLAVPATAQTIAKTDPLIAEFYQLITGKWTRISDNAGIAITEEQVKIAAIQCYSVRELNAETAAGISSISRSLSQKLSRLIVYQKLDKGLRRVDFGARVSLLLPSVKTGSITASRKNFEIANDTVKIPVSFARLKQGGNYVAVMIEGKALYLKCVR